MEKGAARVRLKKKGHKNHFWGGKRDDSRVGRRRKVQQTLRGQSKLAIRPNKETPVNEVTEAYERRGVTRTIMTTGEAEARENYNNYHLNHRV